MSIRQRVILQDIGATTALGVGRLAVRTVLFTLGCEAAGALLLWLRFGPRFGAGYGLWLAVFHAVSAFTNGSFDLFGGHGKSLADYRADSLVLLTMAGLIISGGLSFLTMHEVVRTRHWRRLSLDSKVILLGTALLLLGGTALLLLTEADNPASLGRLPFAERVLNAFFHAAAARTSGFTTWDFSHSDPQSVLLVGLDVHRRGAGVDGRRHQDYYGRRDRGRRLPPGQLAQALAVAALALGLILNITLAISLIEGHRLRLPFINLLFEVTSAFGTVGFSAGVTAQLSTASRLLLIATMFVGRLGPVTVAAALAERHRALPYRLPSEPIRIG